MREQNNKAGQRWIRKLKKNEVGCKRNLVEKSLLEGYRRNNSQDAFPLRIIVLNEKST